jgi:hypothetical protein
MVMLIDAESGDMRLAEEHRKKSWPAQLEFNGLAHDYVVLDADDQPVERSVNFVAAWERARHPPSGRSMSCRAECSV